MRLPQFRLRSLMVVIAFVAVVVVRSSVAVTIVLTLTDFSLVNIVVVFMRAKGSVTIGCPRMFVVYPPVISIPVAVEESLSVMARYNPVSAEIRWPTPISVMPFVMVPHRRPVTLYP